ncbi:MAG: hypothetical protein H8D96_21995 [Desulfobacterales bacterium]|uniref:Uncharacterized protein n=1 Tax=Candidatus Desulfatibia vada TaxID=2841696 RepID=A0A8J6P2E0_9BACT|nr:hypothetical protein [Candidatus Desulfatibia vada]
MDELEKWAKDKPKSLVMLSSYFATVADTAFFMLKDNNKWVDLQMQAKLLRRLN